MEESATFCPQVIPYLCPRALFTTSRARRIPMHQLWKLQSQFAPLTTILALTLFLTIGCSPTTRQNVASGLAAAAYAPSPQKIMIFGGVDHRTYLGCLSCSEYATDSVFNEYGSYGSRYSSTSIWNHYAEFGSRYSNEGACNPYANDPPVIVDSDGNYYGRLTLNSYHPQLGAGAKSRDWLEKAVCEE